EVETAVALEKEGQSRLRRRSRCTLTVSGRQLWLPHLLARRLFRDGVVDRRRAIGAEKNQILRHIIKRRIQAAIGHRDSSIEIEAALFDARIRSEVTVRSVRQQMVRCSIEE